MSSIPDALRSRARFAALLVPALLSGCYVVPIVPVGRPMYRPYPGPYPGPYRGYYRMGQAEAVPVERAGAPAPAEPDHIDVASISR
jgi:hypothetical protein